MSEQDTSDLTELQFQILNAMMDDAEDIEQIYLAANIRALSHDKRSAGLETASQRHGREFLDFVHLFLSAISTPPDA
jgi:hypothetical protein